MANEDWAQALAEAEDPQRRDAGLWARCFAEAGGDEGKAKAAYVKQKVGAFERQNMGYCPGCTAETPLDSVRCSHCGADFLRGGWKPVVNRPRAAAYGAPALNNPQVVKSAKSRGIYIILAIFFGMLGIHNFYINRFAIGAAQFIITCVLGWFVIGLVITFFWVLIDVFTVKKDGAGDALA